MCLFAAVFLLFSPQNVHAKTITIDMQDRQFNPKVVTIAPGDTVTWTNSDSMIHTTTSDSTTGSQTWDSGVLQQGKSYSKTFTNPGIYTYHCLPHPDMTGTIQVSATQNPSTPTKIPTIAKLPTATQTPTDTPSPQLSSSPTAVSLTLFLNGIGKAGDSVLKGSGNPNPNRPMRPAKILFYNMNDVLVAANETTVMYDPLNGNFSGTTTVNGLSTNHYSIMISVDGFLENMLLNQLITAGQTVTLPPLYLVTGDMNYDNLLNALDYNVLLNCFESKMLTSACQNKQTADVNDDGAVNGTDYNLFLRELFAASRM